ncbi:hypothetical protein FGG08_004316 [Glutinoglossum americanum]|uniref:Uncharacterized protein n=1 Tax=Glutinoglossum americanum TaxID=1670608 RepID=A0A9P8L421_9PEZI|nr:hypothetical protein FGG08_004316 [Glutinoglossum americanum]
MEAIDTDWPDAGDMGIPDDLLSLDRFSKTRKHSAIEELVRALSYRFRVQEEIFVIAKSLMHLGLLSHQALYRPMDLSRSTPSISSVVSSLRCFNYVADAMSPERKGLGGGFDAPVIWLATVIVRSCTDWTRILDRLVTVQRLGSLDQACAAKFTSSGPRFTINAREGEAMEVVAPQYGIWLPHGVSMKGFAGAFLARYCTVKETYEDIMGEGSWGDSSMLEAAVTRILAAERISPDNFYETMGSSSGL